MSKDDKRGRKTPIEGLEGLSSRVAGHMKRKGIDRATGPQIRSFRPVIEGKDVLIIAPTGFGKTEAVFAPLLQKLHEGDGEGIRLLYIAPLRALNRDILERMEGWCSDLGLTIGVRHSDTTTTERNRQARRPPDVLVTTPETLQIMFTGSRLRKGLANVRHVIIDEVHEFYMDERGAQLDMALSRLDHLTGRRIQRIGLSATVWDHSDVARFMAGPGREVDIIRGKWSKEHSFLVDSPAVVEKDIERARELGCTPKVASVLRRVVELSSEYRSILLFVNSRDLAEALTTRLRAIDDQLPVGIHHGSLSREARMDMEREFKAGSIRIMVCTSSMELGMDIGAVDLVIQFKSPKEVSRLLQRAGRAGHRIGDVSRCIILTTEADDVLEAGVIANLALRGRLEAVKAREGILSVLANQIISTASSEKELHLEDLLEMLRNTYTFGSMDPERVMGVITYLHRNRIIYFDEENSTIRGGRNAREYFHENISMIPDERVMLIRDLSTRKIIGSLDMDFVLSNLEPFSKFIVRGQPWRVVDIGDEEITVEPVSELGPVPAWSGSDIPVPWEVAREVGRIRREVVRALSSGGSAEEVLKGLPLSESGVAEVVELLEEQTREGFETPDDRIITIERGQEGIVIGCCSGTRVNETLGRIFASLISARYGGNVVMDHDPYRILLMGDIRLKAGDIEWALHHSPTEDMEHLVPVLLRNSPLLRWQMFHVAKKFGVLRKDEDPKRFPLRRLLTRWKDSPVMEEAISKIIHERMDLPHAREIIEKVLDGDIELVIQKVSPLTMSGSMMRREFMTPENASSSVVTSVRERLMTTPVRLTCMNCGSVLRATAERAKNIKGCYRCGSLLMAPIPSGDIRTRQAVEKGIARKRLTEDEKKRFRAAMMAAELFSEYGYRAVMALSGRGVGPKTAGRILEMVFADEDELTRKVFGEEIRYARTRRFWD